jgi:predicted metalloprotease with PDZ domain
VIENRAAARAGLGPGMRLVAVNGHRFSPEVLDAALAAAHDSHQAIELLIEHDDVFRTLHVEYFDGVRFPHLSRIDERPDTLTQVLAARGG